MEKVNKKNAILISVFGEEHIYEMSHIFLKSLYKNSNMSNIDVLIVASHNFKDSFGKSSLTNKDNVTFLKDYDMCSVEDISWSRYEAFEIFDMTKYNKVLYLDVDIVISSDISNLFDIDMKNPVYASNEWFRGNLTYEYSANNWDYHGGWFFMKNNMVEHYHKNPFSTGAMLFDISEIQKIKQSINNAKKMFESEIKNRHTQFYNCDQPSVNISFTVDDIVNPCGLDDYLIYNPLIFVSLNPPIAHFAGGIGNTSKLERMHHYYQLIKC